MSNPDFGFTSFDEMVLVGDLRELEVAEDVRELRRKLKADFALSTELGLEEIEEPEED